MSHGASIYSTNFIPWEEFRDFVLSLKDELPEITISVASSYPEVGLYRGKEWMLVVLRHQTNDPERLLEDMSLARGTEQKTLLILDMNSLPLAKTLARAFARRYPCLFLFTAEPQDNQELLAEDF